MSSILARKQEETYQKQVRDLLRLPENKKCFDCPTKGPAYVNTTIQTFVCSRCSGLVREAGHRVKSVSASKFSGPESIALRMGGNAVAQKIWLSNYSTPNSPEPEADDDVRSFMRQKYYENKWLDRNLLFSHNQQIRNLISQSFNEDGQPIKPSTAKMSTEPHIAPTSSFSQPFQLPKLPVSPTTTISFDRKRVSIDSQRSSVSSSSERYPSSVYSNKSSQEHHYSPESNSHRQSLDSSNSSSYYGSTEEFDRQETLTVNTSKSSQITTMNPIQQIPNVSKLVNNNIQTTSTGGSASSSVTPIASKTRPISTSSDAFDSIMSDLAGLKLEKTVRRATYTGGILSPSSTIATPVTPTPVSPASTGEKTELFDSDFFSKFNSMKTTDVTENDQYAALRGIVAAPTVPTKEEEKHVSSSEEDDEDDWQEFCSSSNFEEDEELEVQPVVNEKTEVAEPVVTMDMFGDLDPRSMFKRF